MIGILKENGYQTSLIFWNPFDLKNLWDLISNERDVQTKKYYKKIFWGQLLILPFLFTEELAITVLTGE